MKKPYEAPKLRRLAEEELHLRGIIRTAVPQSRYRLSDLIENWVSPGLEWACNGGWPCVLSRGSRSNVVAACTSPEAAKAAIRLLSNWREFPPPEPR